MAKVLSFPDGKQIPVSKTKSRESVTNHQNKKFADALKNTLWLIFFKFKVLKTTF